jgi:hypothetical protein
MSLYNRIELVGDWHLCQLIGSCVRDRSIEERQFVSEQTIKNIIKEVESAIQSYIETDEQDDVYFYKYEFRVTRQRQNPEDLLKE